MKKFSLFLSGFVFLFLLHGFKAQSQTNAEYFGGKWNVVVAGTPNGDAKMVVSLENKDGKLNGVVLDSTNTEIAKITKIEEKDKSITAYFNAQGYDVYLNLEPVDADHVKGTLLDMFDAKGERVKENK
jgi:hypothetical protein